MDRRSVALFVVCVTVLVPATGCWGLDESALTPTSEQVVPAEEQEFQEAMAIWKGHHYAEGQRLLREFSNKHPKSRWAAEADLHVGCYLTYTKRYDEARKVFKDILAKHPKGSIAIKARIRLGNVAEQTGKLKEAVRYYGEVLQMGPTWDQFRYANFRARTLIPKLHRWQAMIDCGPTALASCLEALGKAQESVKARALDPGEDGMSLARLISEARAFGVESQAVQMSFEDLRASKLPVIAHVQPGHYVAVLALDGEKLTLDDSIQGRREAPLAELELKWTGKVLVFDSSTSLKPLSASEVAQTLGGCCAQAAEPECGGGDFKCPCSQEPDGPAAEGSNGPRCIGCGDDRRPQGRPTWMMNTNNLNLIVQDTPIWYDPGRGPKVEFAMTYSNENSNTGFFGPGWRCQYDMRVFFLPSYYENYPTLQVHRADNRIETYEWDGFSSYQPRTGMGNYGYRDTIEKLQDGTVVLTLREGGKYRFNPAGHIYEIEDNVGKKVTCTWSVGGDLTSVTDANNRVTLVTTGTHPVTGNKQITVTLPSAEPYVDSRTAVFDYDSQGRLTGITDMRGYPSTFTYDALAWGNPNFPTTLLQQYVTESDPPNGGNLRVEDSSGFPPSGSIRIRNTNPTEVMGYGDTGYDSGENPVFKYILRGEPRCTASPGATVELVSVPYLQTIVTLAGKTKFEYQWWILGSYGELPIVGLHNVYECGPSEGYPDRPTRHYAWCPTINLEYTKVVRYPQFVGSEVLCTDHWTGGLTKRYQAAFLEDALGSIVDESGKTLVNYTYDAYRNRTSAADGRGYVTRFTFGAYHLVLTRTDPMNNTSSYTYENYRVKTVRDSYNNLIAKYTYNAAGQIEKIESEMPPGPENSVTLSQNFYDDEGRLDHTIDGLGKTTSYDYETEPGSRGFLISVEDAQHNVTSYTYDAKGRRHSVTDPRLNTTTYDYDNLDRLVKVTNADGTTVEYSYACCGLDWKKDENQKTTWYHYDSKKRLYQVEDANHVFTTYNYNGQFLDRLDSITDAEGNMTSYQYYANGAVDKITFPDGTWEHYVYDDAGNLVTKSNGKDAQTERTITYSYDPNNRLVSVCSDPP